ncbi:MAG: branched-chain amino acid transport system II carrier protein [Erysipelotrichaceae bacterium]
MKKLKISQRILVAMTLFGMFFGAGNLIFPVHLGQLAGNNYLGATIGFIVTAVSIPILAVAAIGITHSDGLKSLSEKVGRKYSYFFTCLLYLTIGPFFAIPRCATTSFTVGIAPMLKNEDNRILLFIFTLLFFAAVLYFSLKPNKITVSIGKIINPIFLIFYAILIITALINPIADISSVAPEAGYTTSSFFNGFIEGYGTMDAIAGLAFGIVVIDIIKQMGVNDDNSIAREVIYSGVLTGLLMAIIYVLTIIIGVQSRGLFETSANGGIALAQIASYYYGDFGLILLAITITFACLKTSIGLVTSCSDAFERMFKDRLSYRSWAIIFTLFSFVISNFGLSKIIEYSIPVLMFIYPLAIVLIVLALCGKFFNHDRRIYLSVISFTLFAALFDFIKTLPNAQIFNSVTDFARKIFPFFDLGLGFIVPAAIGLVIGLLLVHKDRNSHLST